MSAPLETKVSRRRVLRGVARGAAGLGALAIVGCGRNESTQVPSPAAAPAGTATPFPATSPTVAASMLTARWTAIAKSATDPRARRDHSLTLTTDGIYLFGGRARGRALNDIWVLNPKASPPSWREVLVSGARPAARFAHNAFYHGRTNELVVAMGQGDGSIFFNDVWAFDAATSSWREVTAGVTERPEIRYGAGGAEDASRGRFLISHGFTDRGRFDDTWTFDLEGRSWTQLLTTGPV